jgi:hydrogenase maturation protein HypF
LLSAFGTDGLSLPLQMLNRASRQEIRGVAQMTEKAFAAPPTSSMGRLFDAVSALLGIRDDAQFEGQPAMELESLASPQTEAAYDFGVTERGAAQPILVSPSSVIRGVVSDLIDGVDRHIIAGAFHNSVAAMIARLAMRIREGTGINKVVLSGGVFQNVLLVERSRMILQQADFDVFTHRLVPCNDGGLSLGQAYIVALRALAESPATLQEGDAICA